MSSKFKKGLAALLISTTGVGCTTQTIPKKAKTPSYTIQNANLEKQIQNIQQHIQNCIKETAYPGLFTIGLQGGYLIPPENYLETNYANIAYGYFKGEDILVTKSKMESELSTYMNIFLPLYTDFSEFLLEINEGSITTKISILEDSVSITVDYPLEIKTITKTFNLNEPYTINIPVRLGLLHNISKEIVANTVKAPTEINLTYLLNTDMDIDVLPFKKGTFVYSLTDEKSKIDNVTYTFMFAVQIQDSLIE